MDPLARTARTCTAHSPPLTDQAKRARSSSTRTQVTWLSPQACTLFVHLAADPITIAPPPQPAARAADAPCAGLGPGEAEP